MVLELCPHDVYSLGKVHQILIASLLARLPDSPLLERLLASVLGRFTTWPADDFARFTRMPIGRPGLEPGRGAAPPKVEPLRPAAPESLAPTTFELRFAQLQREGRYDRLWTMLAEDAQRAWGGEDRFIEQMQRQNQGAELLATEVGQVEIVPEWTDQRRNRTYRNVARLAVRYRLKLDWRELAVDRQVHLIPAADGWRTLCYP